ncbi:MAG: M48 family metallopeptidase [Beijerinckiaceae bacterium]
MLQRILRLLDPPSNERIEVQHLGLTYPVVIKRSAQARRYTLRVKAASREAVLTMPARGSMATAKDFAARHGGWLAARYAKLPEFVDFVAGALVPLRGIDHRIEHRPTARGTAWAETTPDGLPVLAVAGDASFLARRVRDFLKREARKDIELAARRHAATLDVKIKRIAIKDTVSRWGSCAADGSLSFSWRMILAPPFVLDYLAAHEVAHRVEMNHSTRYWRVVASIYPDYERAEAWLKRHGAELHRWG